MADHVVGDERERNLILLQFPGGEAGAFQVRTGFGNEHVNLMAFFHSDAHHAESGADAAGAECAAVALSLRPAGFGEEVGAEFSDAAIGSSSLFVNFLR